MTRRPSADYTLYAVNGDRGLYQFGGLLQNPLAFEYGSLTWSPRNLVGGMRRCDIHIDGFEIDPQWMLDTVAWGMPDAVMLVEIVTPWEPGRDYQIRTFRPGARFEVTS